jgi:hypothetical protein
VWVQDAGELTFYRYAMFDTANGAWSVRVEAWAKTAEGNDRLREWGWATNGPFCPTPQAVEAVLEQQARVNGWTEVAL